MPPTASDGRIGTSTSRNCRTGVVPFISHMPTAVRQKFIVSVTT